jgi:IS4 transposase
MAHLLGCTLTIPAIEKRFSPLAADFLLRLLLAAVHTAVEADPINIPVLRRFVRVEVCDSSIVILPDELANIYLGCGTKSGSKRASVKLLFRLDLTRGRLLGPLLFAGRVNDRVGAGQLTPPEVGSLQIGDLGFFCLRQFHEWDEQGVYWLSRYKCGTYVYDTAGHHLDLLAWLRMECGRGRKLDAQVLLGARARLACRLIAQWVPGGVVRKRRAALREEARKDNRPINPIEWELARWTILVTNCTGEQLSVEEAFSLQQARWQVELLIKRNKSLGQIDEWRSKRQWRVVCEVYAKLLVQVLQHWLLVVGCWADPARSLWRGQQMLQRWGWLLGGAWGTRRWLAELTRAIEMTMTSSCRIDKRRTDPSLWQRLLQAAPPLMQVPQHHGHAA